MNTNTHLNSKYQIWRLEYIFQNGVEFQADMYWIPPEELRNLFHIEMNIEKSNTIKNDIYDLGGFQKWQCFLNYENQTEKLDTIFLIDCWILFHLIQEVYQNQTILELSPLFKYLPVSWKYSLLRVYWIDDISSNNINDINDINDNTNRISCKFIIREKTYSKL